MKLPPLPPLNLSHMHCVWLLRRLRADRDKIRDDMLLIEERIKSGHDGELTNAHRALDADAAIADQLIRMLWQTCGSHEGSKAP